METGSPLNILLVEDEVALAEMYRIRLACEGYLVRVAVDGPSGLQQAIESALDLLLSLRTLRPDPAQAGGRLR